MRKEAVERTMKKCGGACVHCGSTQKLEVDHIIPTSRGGEHSEHNFQILCRKCNRSKKDKVDWLRFFKIDESKDSIYMSKDFINILVNLSPKEHMLLWQEIALLHAAFWERRNKGIS